MKRIALLSYRGTKKKIPTYNLEIDDVCELYNNSFGKYSILEEVIWDEVDPFDLKKYDLVVVKTPWDYQHKFDKFVKFLKILEKENVHVENPVSLILWNAVKAKYLLQLQKSGVNIIPTTVINSKNYGDLENKEYWKNLLKKYSKYSNEFVIKPSVSAGSFKTKSFSRDDILDSHYPQLFVKEILELGTEAMIQPMMKEVRSYGEVSLFYVYGTYTHCVVKTPKTGDFRSQEEFGGKSKLLELEEEEANILGVRGEKILEFGENACKKIMDINKLKSNFLLCRIDVIVRNANNKSTPNILLMEAETIEPSMYPQCFRKVNNILVDAIFQLVKSK